MGLLHVADGSQLPKGGYFFIMKQRQSIRFVFSVFLIIITVVTTGCIFFITNSFYLQSNKKNSTDLLQAQVRQEASILSYQLNFAGRTAVNLADIMETMPVYDQENIIRKFDEKLSNEKLLFGVGVWLEPGQFRPGQKYYGPYMYRNDQGQNTVTWQYNTAEYDYFQWDWYRVAKNSPRRSIYFSQTYYDPVLNTFFLTTTAPIIKKEKLVGVATTDISIREVADYVQRIKVGYHGYGFVLTDNGYIIGSPPFIAGREQAAGSNMVDSSIDGSRAQNSEYIELQKAVKGSSSGLVELKGNNQMAAFSQIGKTGLSLVLIYPQAELYGNFYQTFGYYLLLFSFSAALCLLLLRFLLRKMIERPINILLGQVGRIMKGDFHREDGLTIPRHSRNEFDIIGLAVNQMADSLDQLVWDLNHQNIELAKSQNDMAISEEKYRLIFEASDEGLWEMDLQRQTRVFSERWYEIFGSWLKSSDLGEMERWFRLIHPDDRAMARGAYQDIVSGRTDTVHCEYRIMTDDGSYQWVSERAKTLKNNQGRPFRMAGAHQNITRQKMDAEKIRHLAYYDALTALPNRACFDEKINRIIQSSGGEKFAVFFMDLDNFKIINDSMGHCTGDQVLQCIAQRLINLTDERIWVSRFGGDEFIMIVSGISDRGDCSQIAEEIHRVVNQPIVISDNIHYVNVSIGIAIYPDDGADLHALLRNSDTAMFAGKARGKDRSIYFESQMNETIMEKTDLEQRLRRALAQDEFVLHYQPLHDIENEQVIGFEALIRWNAPGNELVLPGKFIQVMEESRLIIPLGKWIVNTACLFVRRLRDDGFPDLRVSINVSVLQLMEADFSGMVLQAVSKAGISTKNLEIEITESKLMEFYGDCIDNITRLRTAGVRFSIDDFGSGYSSFSYLHQLPITALKIDRSFIEVLSAENETNLAELIIIVAHKMGLEVVAEGVETEEQYALLTQYRCDIIQGYLFSRPLPENAALLYLEQPLQEERQCRAI